MKILILGGTGYIGRSLCAQQLAAGNEVFVLSRQPAIVRERCGDVQALTSLSELDGHMIDQVFNFAGAPIADGRWTRKRKNEIWSSRVGLTQALYEYFSRQAYAPQVLISASAIGYYGDQGSQPVIESSPANDEYTHQLCLAWEQAASQFGTLGTKISILRLGVVIGKNSGFLTRLYWPYKLGLGGVLGSGEQWLSWVSIEDVKAVVSLASAKQLSGVINLTSPEPLQNKVFNQVMGKVLKRPTLLPMPTWVLKLLFGEMSRLLITGQKVIPQVLLDADYRFAHKQLESALMSALASNK